MFTNGTDTVVELKNDPGPTPLATWIDPNSFRLNDLTEGYHEIRLFLVNDDDSAVGNLESDVAISLVVGPPVNGTVVGSGTYAHGTQATLAATPNPEYRFSEWSGDLSSTDNPLTVTVTSDLNLTAEFEETPPEIVVFIQRL